MHRDLNEEHLKQEVTVTLPLSAVLRLADSAPAAGELAFHVPSYAKDLPAIGEDFGGGKYAGLSIEDNKPVALILLPGSIEDVSWDKATAWAKEQGGDLPSRIDQLVLFKNLKSEFKEAAYWSAEQHAGYGDYAWGQTFTYGNQSYWRKDYSGHGRAVRRAPIQ